MIKGVKNLVAYGFSVEKAIRCGTANPAEIMKYGTKGVVSPGSDADIIVFDKHFNVLLSMVEGKIVKNLI